MATTEDDGATRSCSRSGPSIRVGVGLIMESMLGCAIVVYGGLGLSDYAESNPTSFLITTKCFSTVKRKRDSR